MLKETKRKQGSRPSTVSLRTSKAKSDHRNSSSASRIAQIQKPVDNTLFSRYELKYRITESKAAAISKFIKPYLHLDRYSQLRPDGHYPIVSLYLDSHDFRLCRETLTGKKNRFKLRVRSYSDDLDYPRFVEIKRRVNNVIIKSRARIKDTELADLFSGASLGPRRYKKDEQMVKQFQFYVRAINAGPVVKVRYLRKAHEGDSENRVRVTFDRKLCYNISSLPEVSLNGLGWHSSYAGFVILEIKFTSRFPAWLSRMVKCFNLPQQSMSKYASSIEQAAANRLRAPHLMV